MRRAVARILPKLQKVAQQSIEHHRPAREDSPFKHQRSTHAFPVREDWAPNRDLHGKREDGTLEDDELLDVEDEATAILVDEAAKAHARMARKLVASNARSMGALGIDLPAEEPHLAYLVKRSRERCLGFLKTKTKDYVRDVREVMSDPDNYGLLPEEIGELLVERGNVAASRAELVARDQTLRLNREVTKQRQTEAGVDSFVWSTSMDERVRPEHQELEGKTFSWANPPPEIDDVNCRCTQVPILPESEDEG